MFGKLMAAVGIGAAQVDTRLESSQVRAGDTVRGEVQIKGGNVSQSLSALSLHLSSEAIIEDDNGTRREPHTWGRLDLTEPMEIGPGEEKTVGFELDIPLDAPLTHGRGHPKTWVATRADIALAVDPRDRDELKILPGKVHQAVFDAMDDLGFRLSEATYKPSATHGRKYVFQEFEFKPAFDSRFAHLNEAELTFMHLTDFVLVVQRDTRPQGIVSFLNELSGQDETISHLGLRTDATREEMRDRLASVLA